MLTLPVGFLFLNSSLTIGLIQDYLPSRGVALVTQFGATQHVKLTPNLREPHPTNKTFSASYSDPGAYRSTQSMNTQTKLAHPFGHRDARTNPSNLQLFFENLPPAISSRATPKSRLAQERSSSTEGMSHKVHCKPQRQRNDHFGGLARFPLLDSGFPLSGPLSCGIVLVRSYPSPPPLSYVKEVLLYETETFFLRSEYR
jgi:hypothetical protein